MSASAKRSSFDLPEIRARDARIGGKNYMFVGSERGDNPAAVIYTLMETTELNGIDPQVWFTDVLSSIAGHKINKTDQLLPWNYKGVFGAYGKFLIGSDICGLRQPGIYASGKRSWSSEAKTMSMGTTP